MKRIGILGGSFNPIHEGHLYIARQAKTSLQLDEVIFMPNIVSPFKDKENVSFEDRYAMVQIAIAEDEGFIASTIESRLSSPSYTVDTMREMIRIDQDLGLRHEYYFIIGDDQAIQLSKWKEIDVLSSMVTFAIFVREQQSIDCPYSHVCVESKLHTASSTQIREGDFRYVSPSVRDYIFQHELYIADIVYAKLTPKRYAHTLSVRQVALWLAEVHHLEKSKLSLAAYLHDIAKYFPRDIMANYMALETEDIRSLHPAIHHQYVGARYVEELLQIHDTDILDAIRYHTTGSDNPYVMALFVADKIEPLRNYDVSQEMEVVEQDLVAGYQLVKEKQKQYIEGDK